jgi:hypothetical protein
MRAERCLGFRNIACFNHLVPEQPEHSRSHDAKGGMVVDQKQLQRLVNLTLAAATHSKLIPRGQLCCREGRSGALHGCTVHKSDGGLETLNLLDTGEAMLGPEFDNALRGIRRIVPPFPPGENAATSNLHEAGQVEGRRHRGYISHHNELWPSGFRDPRSGENHDPRR